MTGARLRAVVLGAALATLACGSDSEPSGHSAPDGSIPESGVSMGAERETTLGTVRGVREGDSWVFRGIPFAAPPVGDLRFRPPEPYPSWSGVRDASKFGHRCAQLDVATDAFEGNEDCLTVNVWAPDASKDEALPVMVWIHGGDNVGGSASDQGFFEGEIYDGRNLAERGQVVFVSIQYRIGAFGFLSHPDFAADNTRGATGNWGLMDQIAALEWVQQNVAAFGGDKSKVTIFGQSAGGDNTCALVASPRSSGLFHRAISMSPGGCHYNDATVSAQVTQAVTAAFGCTGTDAVACLRNVDADAMAHAPQSGSPIHPDRVDFYVEIDGWVLSEPPLDTFRAGKQNALPVMFGTTAEEYSAILASAIPVSTPPEEYSKWLIEIFGAALAPQVEAIYDPADYGSVFVALLASAGDAVHHCSVRAVTRAAAASQTAPVFRYVYAHAYDDERLAPYGAGHGFDLPLVFANPVGIVFTPDEIALSDKLLGAFARFARTGDPDQAGGDDWPEYDEAGDRIAVIESPWSTTQGWRKAECDFWDGVWAQ